MSLFLQKIYKFPVGNQIFGWKAKVPDVSGTPAYKFFPVVVAGGVGLGDGRRWRWLVDGGVWLIVVGMGWGRVVVGMMVGC